MSDRRRTDDSRDSRDRADDRGSSRDRDDRSRDRSSDDRGSRDRGERGSRDRDDRGSRDRGDDRGSSRRSSGSGSRYEYEPRSAESVRNRASKGANDFDKIVQDHIKMWKVNDGDNRIRIMPPGWKKADHFGFDIYVHYGVGPDRQSYLDLAKMKDEADPINEEREKFKREMDSESKGDQAYLKELESKRRVGIYLIDRDNEREGVQFWAMPWTVDRDIVKVSVDKSSGEVLPIDHPEDGYDVEFEKKGAKDRTEYLGVAIARRSTPLGKSEWLDYALDNPIPDQLKYYDYDYIAKAFGGGGEHKERDRGDSRDDRGSRDRDERGGDDRGRDRDDKRGSSRDRDEGKADDLTWETIHEMRPRELEALIDQEKINIDPREAKDDEDLADWICDELKIKKAEPKSTRRVVDSGDSADDKLRKMRERRE